MNTPSEITQYFTKDRQVRSVRFTPYLPGKGPRFCLTVYDTYARDHMGKNVLAYRLTMDGKKLFAGADFSCAPGWAIDSDNCMECLMGFLTLRPGDTDAEYFAKDTPEQTQYREQWAESLNCEVANRFCDENGNVIKD